MSHLNRQPSEWGEPQSHEAPQAAAPTLGPNVLTGVVTSRTTGLTRTTYRIRIGNRTDLRMRWPIASSSCRTLEIGQTVRLMIPQEAVHLEAGGFRRGKQRWNRWVGRVVLAAQTGGIRSTTVKTHQDPITLKSCVPVVGAHTPPATWDTVNIVVDPQQIKVCSCALASKQEPSPRRAPAAPISTPASVWLHATIRSVRSIPIGHHLTLSAGGATLSILIETDGFPAAAWRAGHSIQVNIGSGDTWVRTDVLSPALPCAVVLSCEFDDARPSNFIQPLDQ